MVAFFFVFVWGAHHCHRCPSKSFGCRRCYNWFKHEWWRQHGQTGPRPYQCCWFHRFFGQDKPLSWTRLVFGTLSTSWKDNFYLFFYSHGKQVCILVFLYRYSIFLPELLKIMWTPCFHFLMVLIENYNLHL